MWLSLCLLGALLGGADAPPAPAKEEPEELVKKLLDEVRYGTREKQRQAMRRLLRAGAARAVVAPGRPAEGGG